MEQNNFAAWMAQQKVLQPSDIVLDDDLVAIGKKVKRSRNGSQYEEFAMTLQNLVALVPPPVGGYATVQDEGSPLPQRSTINFVGTGVEATDNGSETIVTIAAGGHTIQDEGVSLPTRSILDFVGTGVTVTDSGTKTVVTIPTPTASFQESITYADLLAKVTVSTLEVGKRYLITDFATKHIIPNSGGVVNTGSVEELIVTAIAVNKLYHVAQSVSRPNDIIHYEITDSTTAGGDKGRIFYRKDTVNNVSTYYDWREVRFRQYNNGQILSLVAGGSSLNTAGAKIVGGTSGAVGYVVTGTGSNTLNVVNHTGLFIPGEVVSSPDFGLSRTVSTVSDYTGNGCRTYVNNGRTSQDVLTFIGTPRNVEIGPVPSTGPSDKLNNITFLTGSSNIYLPDGPYNCTFNTATNLRMTGTIYNNYFRGGVSGCDTSTLFTDNQMYGAFTDNVVRGTFVNNVLEGTFFGNSLLGYYFGLNTVAHGFKYNTVAIRVTTSNIYTRDFSNNQIDADVQGVTFLFTATHVANLYTKKILKASTGTLYLEYYDGVALQYVDPLTA